MKTYAAAAIVIASLIIAIEAQAETFDFATGNHFWNVPANWTPDNVPNTSGAIAILPGPDTPAGDLTIELGEDITIGSLEVLKPTTPNTGNTTITGANTLTIAGGTSSLVNRDGSGVGVTVINVPVQFDSTFNVDQESDNHLRFTQPLSGLGGLTVRGNGAAGVGPQVVVLTAANTYQGPTILSSVPAADDWLVVRLNNASAIPAASNLALGSSTVLEIASGNFTRALGTGPGQVHFTGSGRNGFSAFDNNRTINLGGNVVPDNVVWGNLPGQANFSQFVLGLTTSTAMVDFVNPLDLNTTGARNIRSYDGTGAIDGRISGSITGAGGIFKRDQGALSLNAANTYQGGTEMDGGLLRLDHPEALPSVGNLHFGAGSVLGIGADTTPADPNSDFARDLGTGSGQIQLIGKTNATNRANAGFSAHGGNRTVVLSGGAVIDWGIDSFLSGGSGTPDRKFILAQSSSDGTLIFKNPINLNGANRTVIARNGTAAIDGELAGVISGAGFGLIKEGSGTLALSGANTYDGATTVADGRLLANGIDSTGTGPVAVNAGTLGGTGSVAGTVTVAAAARIAPGVTGVESLDVGGLTLSAGSFLDFDLAAPGASDLLNITLTNGFTIDGGTVNLFDAGGLAAGNYTLIDYAGTLQGSGIAAFLGQTPTGPAGFTYMLDDTGSTIDLLVTALAPTNDADFNEDGIIDAADYVVWRKFNSATGTGTQQTGDANGDTNVDGLDYNKWRETFGTAAPGAGGGSQGVPEPSTALLMLSALAALFLARRSRSPAL